VLRRRSSAAQQTRHPLRQDKHRKCGEALEAPPAFERAAVELETRSPSVLARLAGALVAGLTWICLSSSRPVAGAVAANAALSGQLFVLELS
jgi:hypothetical protein